VSADLVYALQQIEKEKGISKEIIVESIEIALVSAYKKNFGVNQNVTVKFDSDTGEFRVFAMKKITQNPQNDMLEVSIEEAKKIDGNLSEEDFFRNRSNSKKIWKNCSPDCKTSCHAKAS
jgi:transcription termination/antitermination protein NusA